MALTVPIPKPYAALQSISGSATSELLYSMKAWAMPERGMLACAPRRPEWIALFDDDDEWFPSKIRRQLEVAASSTIKFPIIFLPHVAPALSYILANLLSTRRFTDGHEPISEYVLARRSVYSRAKVP